MSPWCLLRLLPKSVDRVIYVALLEEQYSVVPNAQFAYGATQCLDIQRETIFFSKPCDCSSDFFLVTWWKFAKKCRRLSNDIYMHIYEVISTIGSIANWLYVSNEGL